MCEIEISHIGKNNVNPDLVCGNLWSLSGDIRWCLFYLLTSFELIQNFPTDTTEKL